MGALDHINPYRMDACDTDDVQKSWLFDGPDARLAEYARYHLPDDVLARWARACMNDDQFVSELLADSREEFEDDMRTAREL